MKLRFPRSARVSPLVQRIRRLAARTPRAIESPLPVEVRRPMAGGFCAVVFGYMTTLPEYRDFAPLLWGCAVLTGGVSVWHRNVRATLAGLLGGAACALVSIPLRLGDAPDFASLVLVCAVGGAMTGSTANSTLSDAVLWVIKLPFRARRVVFLVLGFALFVAASVDAEAMRQFVAALPRGAGVLVVAAVGAAVAGAVVSMTAGWMVGRTMRRAAAASRPAADGDGDAWEYWEAHSRW